MAGSKSSWAAGPGKVLSLPPQWLAKYDDFVTKNASQVSQIESALRSLTYIIPGRFRDAEIASETIHSSVQLLSLYHDFLLQRAAPSSANPKLVPTPSLHLRYTRFWSTKSPLYRRVALCLQIVQYTELLCEMAAKRRGERIRWRVVVLLEAVKAVCKLIILRLTRSRPVVSPALPERQPVPEVPAEEDEKDGGRTPLEELMEEYGEGSSTKSAPHANGVPAAPPPRLPPSPPASPNGKEWVMPRTGLPLPPLPQPADISSYLLSRVLTADDIKPATKLLSPLRGSPHAAEVLHIIAPLAYAILLARYHTAPNKRDKSAWTPWVVGLGLELAARQLRGEAGSSLRQTALEREEWAKRAWAMGWWGMRGAFYENVTRGMVKGVVRRMPSLVGGILEDYEYLWENYYFSTSS